MKLENNKQRDHERAAFLEQLGWQGARELTVIGDASTRSYRRLALGDRQALLMDAPVAAETAACPQAATVQEREALGYNALARLAGPNLHAFTSLANVLRAAGLHAPEIYAADACAGFSLIEDLGDNLYAHAIPQGLDEGDLYRAAIDALMALQQCDIEKPASSDYALLDYDNAAFLTEVSLLSDWYWPFVKAEDAPDEVKGSFLTAWRKCLSELSEPDTLVLRDYHAENILWLPDQKGLDRVGIIDFQDGLYGHKAYDLVSLLEDARRDVSSDIVAAMIQHYESGMQANKKDFDKDQFETDYAILAAQRNAKILGIFARLVNRDGKDRYVDFIPRVRAHFAGDLARDAVMPVRTWAAEYFPELISV